MYAASNGDKAYCLVMHKNVVSSLSYRSTRTLHPAGHNAPNVGSKNVPNRAACDRFSNSFTSWAGDGRERPTDDVVAYAIQDANPHHRLPIRKISV